jgi:WD40-like Beta Propeller Repeat
MTARRQITLTDELLTIALTREASAGQAESAADEVRWALRGTAQRRAPRLAWPWTPVLPGLTASTARRRLSTLGAIALMAMLLVLALAVIGLVASRPHLPAPFGLARPGLIAYDIGGEIFVANPDGTRRRQLTSGQSDGGEMFSHDGTRIAYQTEAADLSSTVMVMDPDGGHPIAIADHLAQVGDIAWSPDSRRVAFSARIAGSSGFRIYIAAVDHPGAVQVGGPDVFGLDPSWSPDGRTIAFKRVDGLDQADYPVGTLWLIDVGGSTVHRLGRTPPGGSNSYLNTAWSPDGKRLAFLAPGVGGNFDVYVIDADGTGERDISNSPVDEYWPSWSPDGTRIAYPTMNLTGFNQGTAVVVDPDGSHRVEFAGTPINSNVLIWSPDGTRLLGYAKDPILDHNVSIAVFDPSQRVATTTIPADQFGSASWQRLAP